MVNAYHLIKNRILYPKQLWSFFLIALLFWPVLNFGQNSRHNGYGVESSISYDYLEDLKIHFFVFYTVKKHEPFIGMEFPINSSPISNYGFNLGYKFFPNKNRQVLDFFFLYLLQGTSRKLYSNSSVNGFSLHNLLGYGFKIYIHKNYTINHFIAAGIENSWFGDYGNYSDLSLIINLGIGINIKHTKVDK